MNTGKYLLPAMLVLGLALIAPMACAAVDIGGTAPDFTLENVTGGKAIHLSDYFDKPTVLVFWAGWCPHCRNELPVIQSLYEEFGSGKKANFIGVSVDRQLADATNEVRTASLTFPNAFADLNHDNRVITDYGISGIPAVFILDKGGIVKYHMAGETSAATIREDLAALGVK